jgi:outer membrane protein TolC
MTRTRTDLAAARAGSAPWPGWAAGRLAAAVAMALGLAACEAPHQSIESIVRRQRDALAKLPEEERARMMRPGDPVLADQADDLVGPGLLTLAHAREVGLRANPDIHAARARLEAALTRIGEARSFYFPQLILTHSSNRTFLTPMTRTRIPSSIGATSSIPSIPQNPTLIDILNLLRATTLGSTTYSTGNSNSFSDHSTVMSTSWLLFDGFAREARLMSAKYTYQASAMALGDVQRLLVRAVDAAYYQAQLGREQVRIATAAEAFSREQLAEAQKRFDARKITQADVLNFEVRVRAAQADLVAAMGLRDTGRVVLAELLGLPESQLPEAVELATLEEESEADLTSADVDEWLERAQHFRPDLAEARHILKARAENITLARGQFSPELSLSGTWGYEKTSNMGYSDDDQSAAAGIELRWQLFSGGFRTSQLQRARAEEWEASAALHRKTLEVCADVRKAIVDLSNAQEQVELQRLNLESATENRRIVQQEYAAGKTSLVRLNEAQRDYVGTEVALAEARIRLRQAWSDLRAAAGAYPTESAAPVEGSGTLRAAPEAAEAVPSTSPQSEVTGPDDEAATTTPAE